MKRKDQVGGVEGEALFLCLILLSPWFLPAEVLPKVQFSGVRGAQLSRILAGRAGLDQIRVSGSQTARPAVKATRTARQEVEELARKPRCVGTCVEVPNVPSSAQHNLSNGPTVHATGRNQGSVKCLWIPVTDCKFLEKLRRKDQQYQKDMALSRALEWVLATCIRLPCFSI